MTELERWHFRVSMLKSFVRVVAGATLIRGDVVACGGLLIFAEVLGVLEEL